MDNPAAARRPVISYAPDLGWSALAVAGLLAAVTAAVVGADPAGRLLFACAAAILGAYATGDLLFRPRLRADPDGLSVRSPLARARLSWAEVTAVRAVTRVRHGLRGVSLEIEAGEQLFVLGRRALGADPAEVAATLRGFLPG